MVQPRAAGRQELSIAVLGPNLPPQYPPSRQPTIWPMLTLLAEIFSQTHRQEKREIKAVPNQDNSSSEASMIGITEREELLLMDSWGQLIMNELSLPHLSLDIRPSHGREAHVVPREESSDVESEDGLELPGQTNIEEGEHDL